MSSSLKSDKKHYRRSRDHKMFDTIMTPGMTGKIKSSRYRGDNIAYRFRVLHCL